MAFVFRCIMGVFALIGLISIVSQAMESSLILWLAISMGIGILMILISLLLLWKTRRKLQIALVENQTPREVLPPFLPEGTVMPEMQVQERIEPHLSYVLPVEREITDSKFDMEFVFGEERLSVEEVWTEISRRHRNAEITLPFVTEKLKEYKESKYLTGKLLNLRKKLQADQMRGSEA